MYAIRRSQHKNAIHLGGVSSLVVTPDAADFVLLRNAIVHDAEAPPSCRLGSVEPHSLGKV